MKHLLIFSLLLFAACKAPKDIIYKDVDHFGLQDAGLDHTQVSMDLHFHNPNNYNLWLKKASVDVYLNSTYLGKMTVKKKFIAPPKADFTLPVTLEVDMHHALSNALQLLLTNTMLVKLNGYITAGRRGLYIRIPIQYEGKQRIYK